MLEFGVARQVGENRGRRNAIFWGCVKLCRNSTQSNLEVAQRERHKTLLVEQTREGLVVVGCKTKTQPTYNMKEAIVRFTIKSAMGVPLSEEEEERLRLPRLNYARPNIKNCGDEGGAKRVRFF